jgi:hypothetical protein
MPAVVMETIVPTTIATAANIRISFVFINNGVTLGLLRNVIRVSNYLGLLMQRK